MINNRGIEFSFAWIFAIFVGAVVIVIAIYATTKFVNTEGAISGAETSSQLGILLTPVETGLESGKTASIKFGSNTRIYNLCNPLGNFGEQQIETSSYGDVGSWSTPSVPITYYNKYIFSSKIVEGKETNVFTKPFVMPYKVADIVIIWSINEGYCLIEPPTEIEREVNNLNLSGVMITSEITNCSKTSKKVCFTTSNCDIDVSYTSSKSVTKNKKVLYYEDSMDNSNSLFYAAIFSDPEIYNCQVKRLMKRTAQLATIYANKAKYLGGEGCASYMQTDLIKYSNETFSLNNSLDLRSIKIKAGEIKDKNDQISGCKVF